MPELECSQAASQPSENLEQPPLKQGSKWILPGYHSEFPTILSEQRKYANHCYYDQSGCSVTANCVTQESKNTETDYYGYFIYLIMTFVHDFYFIFRNIKFQECPPHAYHHVLYFLWVSKFVFNDLWSSPYIDFDEIFIYKLYIFNGWVFSFQWFLMGITWNVPFWLVFVIWICFTRSFRNYSYDFLQIIKSFLTSILFLTPESK